MEFADAGREKCLGRADSASICLVCHDPRLAQGAAAGIRLCAGAGPCGYGANTAVSSGTKMKSELETTTLWTCTARTLTPGTRSMM